MSLSSQLGQRIAEAHRRGQPALVVLAGCNGAGKSTFYAEALSGVNYPLVNADEIAQVMAEKTGRSIPDLAYEAMHQAATLRADLVTHRQSFIMETVLSDAQGAKLDFLKAAQLEGFFLIFIHITLADVEISIARVAQRVLNGGHDVPDEKLLARFPRTQVNAAKALAMADAGFVFDNSDPQCPYRLVETWERGTVHTQTK